MYLKEPVMQEVVTEMDNERQAETRTVTRRSTRQTRSTVGGKEIISLEESGKGQAKSLQENTEQVSVKPGENMKTETRERAGQGKCEMDPSTAVTNDDRLSEGQTEQIARANRKEQAKAEETTALPVNLESISTETKRSSHSETHILSRSTELTRTAAMKEMINMVRDRLARSVWNATPTSMTRGGNAESPQRLHARSARGETGKRNAQDEHDTDVPGQARGTITEEQTLKIPKKSPEAKDENLKNEVTKADATPTGSVIPEILIKEADKEKTSDSHTLTRRSRRMTREKEVTQTDEIERGGRSEKSQEQTIKSKAQEQTDEPGRCLQEQISNREMLETTPLDIVDDIDHPQRDVVHDGTTQEPERPRDHITREGTSWQKEKTEEETANREAIITEADDERKSCTQTVKGKNRRQTKSAVMERKIKDLGPAVEGKTECSQKTSDDSVISSGQTEHLQQSHKHNTSGEIASQDENESEPPARAVADNDVPEAQLLEKSSNIVADRADRLQTKETDTDNITTMPLIQEEIVIRETINERQSESHTVTTRRRTLTRGAIVGKGKRSQQDVAAKNNSKAQTVKEANSVRPHSCQERNKRPETGEMTVRPVIQQVTGAESRECQANTQADPDSQSEACTVLRRSSRRRRAGKETIETKKEKKLPSAVLGKRAAAAVATSGTAPSSSRAASKASSMGIERSQNNGGKTCTDDEEQTTQLKMAQSDKSQSEDGEREARVKQHVESEGSLREGVKDTGHGKHQEKEAETSSNPEEVTIEEVTKEISEKETTIEGEKREAGEVSSPHDETINSPITSSDRPESTNNNLKKKIEELSTTTDSEVTEKESEVESPRERTRRGTLPNETPGVRTRRGIEEEESEHGEKIKERTTAGKRKTQTPSDHNMAKPHEDGQTDVQANTHRLRRRRWSTTKDGPQEVEPDRVGEKETSGSSSTVNAGMSAHKSEGGIKSPSQQEHDTEEDKSEKEESLCIKDETNPLEIPKTSRNTKAIIPEEPKVKVVRSSDLREKGREVSTRAARVTRSGRGTRGPEASVCKQNQDTEESPHMDKTDMKEAKRQETLLTSRSRRANECTEEGGSKKAEKTTRRKAEATTETERGEEAGEISSPQNETHSPVEIDDRLSNLKEIEVVSRTADSEVTEKVSEVEAPRVTTGSRRGSLQNKASDENEQEVDVSRDTDRRRYTRITRGKQLQQTEEMEEKEPNATDSREMRAAEQAEAQSICRTEITNEETSGTKRETMKRATRSNAVLSNEKKGQEKEEEEFTQKANQDERERHTGSEVTERRPKVKASPQRQLRERRIGKIQKRRHKKH